VALARLTLHGANFLLLDEPTNHLDLASQEILEDVLRNFPGTVLLVSHDRYLVQALATHVWRVDGEELRAYEGAYEDYQRLRAIEEGRQPAAADEAAERAVAADRDRERMREERRQRKAAEKQAEQMAALENRIGALEAKLASLSTQLEAASLAGDVGKIHSLGVTYEATEAELHQVMGAWAEVV
jgi:ATP-binding cassette subfamily F protein 3